MPEAVGGRRACRAEADAEVAVPVGGDPLLGAGEAGDQAGAGDAAAQEPPSEVDRVAGGRAPERARAPGRSGSSSPIGCQSRSEGGGSEGRRSTRK